MRLLLPTENFSIEDNHARLDWACGLSDLRYARPNLTISSKSASWAKRPDCVRYHLRSIIGFERMSRLMVFSRAFTRFSTCISVITVSVLVPQTECERKRRSMQSA